MVVTARCCGKLTGGCALFHQRCHHDRFVISSPTTMHEGASSAHNLLAHRQVECEDWRVERRFWILEGHHGSTNLFPDPHEQYVRGVWLHAVRHVPPLLLTRVPRMGQPHSVATCHE